MVSSEIIGVHQCGDETIESGPSATSFGRHPGPGRLSSDSSLENRDPLGGYEKAVSLRAICGHLRGERRARSLEAAPGQPDAATSGQRDGTAAERESSDTPTVGLAKVTSAPFRRRSVGSSESMLWRAFQVADTRFGASPTDQSEGFGPRSGRSDSGWQHPTRAEAQCLRVQADRPGGRQSLVRQGLVAASNNRSRRESSPLHFGARNAHLHQRQTRSPWEYRAACGGNIAT